VFSVPGSGFVFEVLRSSGTELAARDANPEHRTQHIELGTGTSNTNLEHEPGT
jgi:hypothetical protein